MFPETRVAKFSAFARIVRCGSEALRALVSAGSANMDGTNDTLDLKWATENLVEKRLAQMTRVLRNTRERAVDAERRLRMVDERLAALMSRVSASAPSPVYDTIVECDVIQMMNDPSTRTGQRVAGPPIHSFTIRMDNAATFAKYQFNQLKYGSVSMGPWEKTPTVEMRMSGMQDITQVIAPMVLPAYGDVIAVPAHFSQFSCSGASGTGTKLVIYASDDVGEQYALKVGEVNRDQVRALIAALGGKSDCYWRRK
jgi:hypothetical protein